ncbi:MAG: YhjD/YihY/BrkB family envelope integrity protein [Solirubrobacterales bacterium]
MGERRDSFRPSRPSRLAETPSGRERAIRTLTFWIRPAFVLRALNRFQRIAGFDRAVALASSALTTLIPLAIVVGALLSKVGGREAAQAIIDRFDLTGGGAEAVRDALSPTSGTSTDLSVIGVLLLVVAVLSFTRGVQRLFEQTWELKSLSVRNTPNSLLWIAGLTFYVLGSGWIHGLLGRGRLEIAANLVAMPLSAAFFVWTGWLLSARRIAWRALMPFGVLAAVLFAAYATAALIWVPHLFSTYASRYGVIGAAFAMVSALFGVMLVIVVSAVIGREIRHELDQIGRGERPADDEVKREWDKVIEEARSRWETLREQVDRLRRSFGRSGHGGSS